MTIRVLQRKEQGERKVFELYFLVTSEEEVGAEGKKFSWKIISGVERKSWSLMMKRAERNRFWHSD